MGPPLPSRRDLLAWIAGSLVACRRGRRATPPIAASAPPPPQAARGGWDPATTLVFAVGVLEWRDAESFSPFPKAGRRDIELVEALRARGVPRENVVMLLDRDATRSRVSSALDAHLARARPGDTLWLYYAGHGVKTERGDVWFAPYDAGPDGERSGWGVRAIFDAIEGRFRGARALLTADCCHSGALCVEARARPRRVSYGCLGSSLASQSSTPYWTFTECLVAGVRGDARVDLDRDGKVTLDELGRYTEREMAFVEGQLASFRATGGLAPDLALGAAGPRPHARVGERVLVEWRGTWYRAEVEAVRGADVRVHYAGYSRDDDEWVPPERVRPYVAREHPPGSKVEVEWKTAWWPATVLAVKDGVHHVHYDGYSDVWDEWVAPARIRPRGS